MISYRRLSIDYPWFAIQAWWPARSKSLSNFAYLYCFPSSLVFIARARVDLSTRIQNEISENSREFLKSRPLSGNTFVALFVRVCNNFSAIRALCWNIVQCRSIMTVEVTLKFSINNVNFFDWIVENITSIFS